MTQTNEKNVDTSSVCHICGSGSLPTLENRQKLGELNEKTMDQFKKTCASLLGGNWMKNVNNITIKKLQGGLTNHLFLCSLPKNDLNKNDTSIQSQIQIPSYRRSSLVTLELVTPVQVLLRIYGDITRRIIDEILVFAMLSEKKLGPKLFGVFEGGRLEEYIESRVLSGAELSQPNILNKIATLLADLHRLNMPISRQPTTLLDQLSEWLNEFSKQQHEIVNKRLESGVDLNVARKVVNIIQETNAINEIEWLRQIFIKHEHKFPVVFCHNDLQENNILYCKDDSDPEGFRLLPIDFEFCCYSYRAFDIGNHFCEWGIHLDSSLESGFLFSPESFPSQETQKVFWTIYLQRAGIPLPSEEEEKEEYWNAILSETAYGMALSNFYWAVWALMQYEMSNIQFDFLNYALLRFRLFHEVKENLPAIDSF